MIQISVKWPFYICHQFSYAQTAPSGRTQFRGLVLLSREFFSAFHTVSESVNRYNAEQGVQFRVAAK